MCTNGRPSHTDGVFAPYRDIATENIPHVDEKIAALEEVRAILADFAEQCEKEGLDKPCSLSFHLSPVLFDEDFFHPEKKSAHS